MIDPVAEEIHAKASKLGISLHDSAYFDKMKPEAKSLIVSHLEAGSDEERIMAYYNTVCKIASTNFRSRVDLYKCIAPEDRPGWLAPEDRL